MHTKGRRGADITNGHNEGSKQHQLWNFEAKSKAGSPIVLGVGSAKAVWATSALHNFII